MKFKRGDLVTIKLPEPTRIGPTGMKIFVDHRNVPWGFDSYKSLTGQTLEVISCKNNYVTYRRPGQAGKLHSAYPYAPISFFVFQNGKR